MKQTVLTVITACLFAGLAAPGYAGEAPKSKPIAVKGKLSLTATVDAIDKVERTLTVKGPKGAVTLPVEDQVARFDQLKVGDRITVQYYESVAFEIEKYDPRSAPDAGAAAEEQRAAGAKAGRTVMTAIVWAVDADTPAVTVKGDAEGAVAQNYRVRGRKYLRDLNVGEPVLVTLTDGLIVGIELAKK